MWSLFFWTHLTKDQLKCIDSQLGSPKIGTSYFYIKDLLLSSREYLQTSSLPVVARWPHSSRLSWTLVFIILEKGRPLLSEFTCSRLMEEFFGPAWVYSQWGERDGVLQLPGPGSHPRLLLTITPESRRVRKRHFTKKQKNVDQTKQQMSNKEERRSILKDFVENQVILRWII